jgi:hypothetical protein
MFFFTAAAAATIIQMDSLFGWKSDAGIFNFVKWGGGSIPFAPQNKSLFMHKNKRLYAQFIRALPKSENKHRKQKH